MNDGRYLVAWLSAVPLIALVVAYLVGSIPWAYIIVRSVTGEDVTTHGTGNVGAMNVRRTTGSWTWFAVAMVADAMKGILPALAAKAVVSGFSTSVTFSPWAYQLASFRFDRLGSEAWAWAAVPAFYAPMLAVFGAVLGHNYSLWMAVIKKRLRRSGKGLATGGGALLAYDWRYFLAVLVVGLAVIAVTRYMMAGQVAAALTLPLAALLLRAPDWPFALFMGLVVYSAHHTRFVGLIQGREPRLYVNDRMGPRG